MLHDRRQLKKIVGVALIGVVFVVGLMTVLQKVGSWLPDVASLTHPKQSPNIKTTEVLDVKKADFPYLVPGKDDAWKYDATSPVYDKTTGVVKYAVRLNYTQVDITFSQQKMPDALKPRDSAKFTGFINNANPARSQNTGRGTVYFLAALQNGAPANGADTVIFATDDVLMFGKAGRVVGYDAWTKLLGTMKPH